MLALFKEYITENQLLSPGSKVLLAISGGVDSMVMLHLFNEAGIGFSAVHCNFSLRGEESDGDEEFVKKTVKHIGCPLYLKRFDTAEYASINGISIEMAARELRYNYFNELCNKKGYNTIATAHHQDDQIETFFLNMSRKTGIRGLSGIKPKSGNLIRPLLFASREMIMAYAAKHKISYREDSSNSSIAFRRNFIRHRILPMFSEINLSYRDNFVATINHLKEVEEVFQATINLLKEKVTGTEQGNTVIYTEKLLHVKFPKVLLYEILTEYHFNPAVIQRVFDSLREGAGKQFFSTSHRLVKDRGKLIITGVVGPARAMFYIEEGDLELFKPVTLELNWFENKGFKIPDDPKIACLDYEKLLFPLVIRKWSKGEYFQPLGMEGFKKLSDFFIDEKFSIPEKEAAWILYSGDKVAWIIGHRIDNRFKITPATRKIYQVKVI